MQKRFCVKLLSVAITTTTCQYLAGLLQHNYRSSCCLVRCGFPLGKTRASFTALSNLFSLFMFIERRRHRRHGRTRCLYALPKPIIYISLPNLHNITLSIRYECYVISYITYSVWKVSFDLITFLTTTKHRLESDSTV